MSSRSAGVAAAVSAVGLIVAGPTAALAGGQPAASPAAVRCPLPVFGPGSSYRPHVEPAAFGPNVTNPLFPLRVGRTMVYRGHKDGRPALDLFVVTGRTQLVDGVVTRVVEDRLYLDDVLVERTSDYYAQDLCGNVWYFGEDTAELDGHGRVVSTEGSFHAGVGGAQPGVFMQARPEVGRTFRQEWSAGQAEDRFAVADLDSSATVPYGTFRHTVRTTERTALEPGVLDEKQYVAGIGELVERSLRGPAESLGLVEIIQ